MKKNLLLIVVLLLQTVAITAQHQFYFKNGSFKVIQFTDIHWDPKSPGCKESEQTLKTVLQIEKPELAVLTGDIVTANPAIEGWKSIIRIFEELQMPFTVTMGNHDAEYLSKKDIYELLVQSPYFVGSQGPNNIKGLGNHAIPIYGSQAKEKIASVLYCIDSNDYPETDELGHYDWIHFSQIEWYRSQSKTFTEKNGGKAVPALAFFHIALPEFRNLVGKESTWGKCEEGDVCSSDINSGMFASFIECQDVMGVFVGHDHDNDFLGQEKGIVLGYGRVTGKDAYGRFIRGGRVIKLYENTRRFDTWITTPKGKEFTYYYPSGITSIDEAGEFLPAQKVKPTQHGVAYAYYEGKFKKTSDMYTGTKIKEGILPNLTISEAPAKDHFGYDFHTYIKIPEKGVYYFYVSSDDGSRLFIDGKEVVDNDGSHNLKCVGGKVGLEAGFHELKLLYFENYMGESLKVRMVSRSDDKLIPDDMLYLPPFK